MDAHVRTCNYTPDLPKRWVALGNVHPHVKSNAIGQTVPDLQLGEQFGTGDTPHVARASRQGNPQIGQIGLQSG